MRKVSVVIVLSMLALVLFGCGTKIKSPSQCWTYNEEYTYDVEYKPHGTELSVKGEYKVIIELVNKSEAKCGEYILADFYGTKISTKLTMTVAEVENTIETVSYISNKLQSKLSYAKYNITANAEYKLAENKTEISAKYDTNKYLYKIGEVEQSIKISNATAFDNNALYVIIRAYDLLTPSLTANYIIPEPNTNTTVPLALAIAGDSVITSMGKEINTTCVNLRLNEQLSGSPIKLYYAKEDITDEPSGAKLPKVLIKIVEYDTTYVLKSIENIKTSRAE